RIAKVQIQNSQEQESACCLSCLELKPPLSGQSLRGHRSNGRDFPRYCRVDLAMFKFAFCNLKFAISHSTDGSTVISRLVGTASRPQHPDVLRCQTSSPL